VRWKSEHVVSVQSDIVASASLFAQSGAESEAAQVYREHRHIAAGGALVTRARLLLSARRDDTIALLVPFPRQRFEGDAQQKAALAAEVLRAMAGVVKSALATGIDVLILPSGAAAQSAEEAYTFGGTSRFLANCRCVFVCVDAPIMLCGFSFVGSRSEADQEAL
jgi:hypothetical protein